MTLKQSFVKIHPACLCTWAVNRNDHSIKGYFMLIMQETHIACALRVEFSHRLRLTVGKQHCNICTVHVTVKNLAECELQTVRKEGRTAILKTILAITWVDFSNTLN
jgi:hypothetical protein